MPNHCNHDSWSPLASVGDRLWQIQLFPVVECVPFSSSFETRSKDSVFDRKVENVVLLWQAAQARNQQASNFQEAVLGQQKWYWHLVACEEHLENTSFSRGIGISIALPVFSVLQWLQLVWTVHPPAKTTCECCNFMMASCLALPSLCIIQDLFRGSGIRMCHCNPKSLQGKTGQAKSFVSKILVRLLPKPMTRQQWVRKRQPLKSFCCSISRTGEAAKPNRVTQNTQQKRPWFLKSEEWVCFQVLTRQP